MRLIFMGTPDFAVPTLLELVAHGHDIAAVYSRAAKPAGRGMKLQPTPVEVEARRLAIPVLTPTTLKTPEALEEFRVHHADAAVVVAYGMILPQAILDTPKLGCFNLHASLLPRWRGAAPINRAIMAGDAETGVMVMKMDAGLDTGDVAMAERMAIRASPAPPRSKRPRHGSTGASPRTPSCAISMDCRRFPARGAKCRSRARLCASKFCAAPWPMAPGLPANCWMMI
jgi:methionyl-tRNA formyltransferase